ncbi:MAG: glutamate--cysteine ligase [Burkholderiaceae bacterium]|jgi:glutamate--cysteine ligase|nr:glutamate--cysteine ligase [Burkholderiaceae bacterium]
MKNTRDRLAALTPQQLLGIRRGIEKESLRTLPDGKLALTPHPATLGAALTHPHITTDFSESQLELITGVHSRVEDCLAELRQIHQVIYHELAAATTGEEMLWTSSMPCGLPADQTIPIGVYGSSNVGRAKSVYRAGLGHRYGRRMQTISGIHYNWSMPGLDNADYFALIRNFRRQAFLLLYLFGASPAVCGTFLAGREHDLEPLGAGSMHLPWATTLRMGKLGYQSQAQSSLAVSYNSLESYAASLEEALTRPYPPYEAIGLRNPEGDYNQLSTTLLQIENEFYGTIRPKRTIFPGERPLHALRERGVEYVEVRLMDLNPFLPIGIDAETVRFLDLFLLHCWLQDSSQDTPAEIAALARNQQATAARGRAPGLQLERGDQSVALTEWAAHIMGELAEVAPLLDDACGGREYALTLHAMQERLAQPENLPSARVLAAIQSRYDGSFVDFARDQSLQTGQALRAIPCSQHTVAQYSQWARQSLDRQRAIEASDTLPFEIYRREYTSPERLRPRSRLPQPQTGED